MSTTSPYKCPQCGALVPANAPGGLCPRCVMALNFSPETAFTDDQKEAALPPAPAELAPRFPQLEIMELLGRGGMGAVYKVRQKELDRIVALKILPPGIGKDPAFAQRFTREAKALGKLNHTGIVTLYEFGQSDGLFFFLMEYVDGVTLRHLLEAGRVSPREALAIVPQICDALQYAHDQGIVHRDIKPENILLDRQGRVKVADFGLAKLVGTDADGIPLTPSLSPGGGEGAPALTDAGKVMGTPQYMAPEQREHPTEVDHRADIYSLGVVFYQMLTGELPGRPIEAPSHKIHIDVRLDEVVLRALEKDPQRRYQQASQVKKEVETIVTNLAGTSTSVMDAARLKGASGVEQIRREVKGPAIGLLTTAILNWILIPLVYFTIEWPHLFSKSSGPDVTLPLLMLTAFGLSAFIIYAALKMMRLEARGAALVASVLAIIVMPGNIIGLPLGIWALVVLNRREVRAAFAGAKTALASVLHTPARRRVVWPWILATVGTVLLVPMVLLALFLFLRDSARVEAVRRSAQDAEQARYQAGLAAESPNRVLDVRCEGRKAYIQAELDDVHDLRLFIGSDALGWSFQHTGSTSVTATVEASSQIKMEDGSMGRGLIFQAWGSRAYIAITPEGPVPYGEVVFRTNSMITQKDGTFTFADIRQTNGTLVPVSILVRPVSAKSSGNRAPTLSASRAFGSPSNAVLPYLAKGGTNCVLLDLDTGRWASNAVYHPDVPEWREWMCGEGMDMLALGRTVPQTMVCFDLGLAPVENRAWETITAADVLNYWPLVTTVAKHQEQLRVDSNTTNTYLFRTREGGRGVLQILGSSTNPPGVNIRYELAQTASGLNAPALQTASEYRTVLVAKGSLTQVVTATGTLDRLPNDPGKWRINALVDEADIVGVDVGQAVAFTHGAFPDRVFHGKVIQVGTNAVTVQNVVCYEAIIEVTSADPKFKPGMTANLRIIVAQRKDVLTIPNAALRFRMPGSAANATTAKSPSERIVYVMRDDRSGQPEPVRIKTGISDGSLTEVSEGLNEGDHVVTGFSPLTSNSAADSSRLNLQQAQAGLLQGE